MKTLLSNIIGFFPLLAGFSGTVGGIFLLINGDWVVLLTLIFAGIVVPFPMAFAMMPSIIIAAPGLLLLENGNKFFGSIFIWLGSVYLGVVFGFWSSFVLLYVFSSTTSFWGAIFAGFGTGISPIIYMTSKSPIENEAQLISNMTANLWAEISLFVMLIYAIFYGGVFDWVIVYVICFSILAALGTKLMYYVGPGTNSE